MSFEIDAVLFPLVNNIAPSGEVGDEHSLPIADKLGIDVFVGLAVLQYPGHMEPAFMRESTVADIGLTLVRLNVGQLVEEVRYLAQSLELGRLDAVLSHLQLQVGNDRNEVEVAAAFAEAVDGSLNLAHAHLNGGHGIRDRKLPIVVAVDSQRRFDHPIHVGERLPNIAGQSTAVGVAQNDPVGAAILSSLETFQRIIRVCAKAIEEVFRVKHHLVHAPFHESD